MKKILFISSILLGFSCFSQTKYEFSGQILFDSFHQGGAYREYIPNPTPMANYSLLLLRYEEGDSIPQIVKTFKSDENGNFTLKVSPGRYGFAATSDSLITNQFLPHSHYNENDMMNTSSSTWSLNDNLKLEPIVVENNDITGIKLLNTHFSICGMCP